MKYLKVVIILVAATLIMGTIGFESMASGQTISPPSLDGSVANECAACTAVTVTLHTVRSPDIVIVYQGDGGNCPGPKIPADSAGLVYGLRADAKYCSNMEGYESYAIAQSPLSSDTITCATVTTTWISCIAFAVSGANTASPFDVAQPTITSTGGPPPNCPKVGNGVFPCVQSMTTSKPNDFVFDLGTDNADNVPSQTAGTGFTIIAATNTIDGNAQDGYVQYKIAPAALTGDNEPFGVPIGNGFIVIGDAIQGAAVSTTSTASTSTSVTESKVTSTCTVVFTMSGSNVVDWQGNC
jgi:hypothetical protein